MSEGTTPTLEEVLRLAIAEQLGEMHTAIPAVVESYDPAKQTITARPSLKRKYPDGSVVERPLIPNVPVAFPRGGGASMTFPLKKGDSVLLVFSMRSLDVWKSKGGVVDPQDARKFHITDAVAIPGGYPESKPEPRASSSNLRIQIGDSEIEMQPGAKFKIGKIGGDELFDLMSQFLQLMLDAKTLTAIGPQPFWAQSITSLTQLKAKVDALKG